MNMRTPRGEADFLGAARGSTDATERAVARNLPMGQPEISNVSRVLGSRDGQVASLMFAASLGGEGAMSVPSARPQQPDAVVADASLTVGHPRPTEGLAARAARVGAAGYEGPVLKPGNTA